MSDADRIQESKRLLAHLQELMKIGNKTNELLNQILQAIQTQPKRP
jgi:hypothetical protein